MSKIRSSAEELGLAKKLRELYPKGKRPGYSVPFAGAPANIAISLTNFRITFDPDREYEDEVIIEATKKYIDSLRGDWTYLKGLEDFIFSYGGTPQAPKNESSLLNWIELGDELIVEEEDWTQTLV